MLTLVFLGEILHDLGFQGLQVLRQFIGGVPDVDVVIGNGNGVLGGAGNPAPSVEKLFDSGIDVIMGGDRSLARPASRQLFGQEYPVLRPLNCPPEAPGKGARLVQACSQSFWAVLLCTSSDKKPFDDPIDVFDHWLKHEKIDGPVVVTVFGHDLALKKAMAWKFSTYPMPIHLIGVGKGIPAASWTVNQGRLFVPDLGTVEPEGSIAGLPPETWWKHHRDHLPQPMASCESPLRINALKVFFDDRFCAQKAELIRNYSNPL